MKVLIVDDEADIRRIARLSLSRVGGMEVVEAASGPEGLRKAAEEKPDAILLDVMMPLMDGPATLAALREQPATAAIPVVFLTAKAVTAAVETLKRLGARGVLTKPFDPMTLAAEVRALLDAPPAESSPMPAGDRLRPQFQHEAAQRLDRMDRLIDLLAAPVGDAAALDELHRYFHGFAGSGTSYGFPKVSSLGQQGDLACSLVAGRGSPPSPAELEQWLGLLAGLRAALAAPWAEGLPATPAPPTRTRPLSVLVVEEDETTRAALLHMLAQEGLTAATAGTASETIRSLEDRLPDGILVAAALSDGSGHNIVRHLRSLPGGHEPVALMVGVRSGFLDKVDAVHCGADGYFSKPVDIEGLTRRLLLLLQERHAAQASRILSMEDDPLQAAMLRAVLEPAGYQVRICAEPWRFEAELIGFRPDLVLMDVVLPDVSGYDLVRCLRLDERHATLPVLFLTGESQPQARVDAARAGGDDHLVKPVPRELLLSAVAARLERSRLLKTLVERDGLTHLLTHTAVLERAQMAFKRKVRSPQQSFVCVMIDLDHFKVINDSHGHAVGDRVLSSLSALLRRRLRQSDTIGRYGGEEFAVLLEELDLDQAVRLVSRLKDEFAATEHPASDASTVRVTFSAGLALLDPETMDAGRWLQAADDALYVAKAAGRNRVVAAPVGQPVARTGA